MKMYTVLVYYNAANNSEFCLQINEPMILFTRLQEHVIITSTEDANSFILKTLTM